MGNCQGQLQLLSCVSAYRSEEGCRDAPRANVRVNAQELDAKISTLAQRRHEHAAHVRQPLHQKLAPFLLQHFGSPSCIFQIGLILGLASTHSTPPVPLNARCVGGFSKLILSLSFSSCSLLFCLCFIGQSLSLFAQPVQYSSTLRQPATCHGLKSSCCSKFASLLPIMHVAPLLKKPSNMSLHKSTCTAAELFIDNEQIVSPLATHSPCRLQLCGFALLFQLKGFTASQVAAPGGLCRQCPSTIMNLIGAANAVFR